VEAFLTALSVYSCRARQTAALLLQYRDLRQFVSRTAIPTFAALFVSELTPAQMKGTQAEEHSIEIQLTFDATIRRQGGEQ
jgi:hypothetical protein